MELKEILSKCDHTLLAQTATWEELKAICDDGMKYGCASVCIPASFVKQAAEYVDGKLPICTVIGFPNGYDTTNVKYNNKSVWKSDYKGTKIFQVNDFPSDENVLSENTAGENI